jgi:hypothetical protein
MLVISGPEHAKRTNPIVNLAVDVKVTLDTNGSIVGKT